MQEVFEKIIERLEEEKSGLTEWAEDEAFKLATDKAIEIVKQEAEQYSTKNCSECSRRKFYQIGYEEGKKNGGWIPVSDRLPENNKVVLCWVVSKTIASGETFIIGSCDRGFWFLQTYEIGHHHFPVKDYEVVAWIPLPQPFQPKGE